jgi:hypothetical protein
MGGKVWGVEREREREKGERERKRERERERREREKERDCRDVKPANIIKIGHEDSDGQVTFLALPSLAL